MHSPVGDADPRLARALATHSEQPSPASRAELLAALVDAQVLAPLAAVATGHEVAAVTGLPAESGAELSLMLLETDGGERALPVFTDLTALRRWRLEARPVPLSGAQACAAALEQGATHLLLDPGGPAVPLDTGELRALAKGWLPVAGSNLASRTEARVLRPAAAPPPALVSALAAALRDEPLAAARLLEGPGGLVLGVASRRRLDAAGQAALAQRVVRALGDHLPAEGLELQQVPVRGPGLRLLRRSWLRR